MTPVDPIEQFLFLEGVFLKYGFDFRHYAESSIQRRILYVMTKFNAASPLALLQKILNDKELFYKVLCHMTTTTTEFFRDPLFFKSLRDNIVPVLKTYPRVNIWIAGCSTGEEIYSLAILLKEENLLERATIFATDINTQALKIAQEGIYSLESMQVFTKNYMESGGTRSPSEYYTANYGSARFDATLKQNVVFSEHNLATDGVFVEANLILCRNVMIYFNKPLQVRVFKLFFDSLVDRGVMGLGHKEVVKDAERLFYFKPLDKGQKIYQKYNHMKIQTTPARSLHDVSN